MKRWISLLLLHLYLFSLPGFSEIEKVPLLIQHYQLHQQQDPEMNPGIFLALHYLSGNAKDADWQQDQELPFKAPSAERILNAVASVLHPAFGVDAPALSDLVSSRRGSPTYQSPYFKNPFKESPSQPPENLTVSA